MFNITELLGFFADFMKLLYKSSTGWKSGITNGWFPIAHIQPITLLL